LGGIPVDRKNKSSVSEQMLEVFNSKDMFRLTIAPEGTRKKSSKWRTGFYYIAEKACVPIILAYIDYSKKKVGMNKIFYPTGDYKSDLDEIKSYYNASQARYPKKLSTNYMIL
jgi:1-acyl-sn-glycerol-3-phosphate acyltransferase